MGESGSRRSDGKLYTTGDILNSDLENIGSTDGQQTVGNFLRMPSVSTTWGETTRVVLGLEVDWPSEIGDLSPFIFQLVNLVPLVLDQLASISSPTEILEAVNSAISNSDLNGNVIASTLQAR